MENTKKNAGLTAILLAFMCMGFGDAVGPFVSLAKEKFVLSNFESQLIAFMGFIMFFLLSIPMGIIQDKTSKKMVLIIGLLVAVAGISIPIVSADSYFLFLVMVLFLGAGNAILQVAGNPIMRDVSPEGTYSRNLTFGQFVKAIGSLSAPLLTMVATNYLHMDWIKLLFPVLGILTLFTIVSVLSVDIQEKKEENAVRASFSSCFKLLGNRYVLMMVMAIFLYVGAEVCMSSGIATYMKENFGIDITKWGIASAGLFFVALLLGRLSGSLILTYISPQRFFLITCLLSLIGILGLFAGNATIAFISAFVVGLGFANIFPLVFSITVDNMPERTNEISGLLVMAIVGGAFIPPLMGLLADKTSVLMGFLVPMLCVLYIMFTAFVNLRSVKKKFDEESKYRYRHRRYQQ